VFWLLVLLDVVLFYASSCLRSLGLCCCLFLFVSRVSFRLWFVLRGLLTDLCPLWETDAVTMADTDLAGCAWTPLWPLPD